jgi:hypothetical protein
VSQFLDGLAHDLPGLLAEFGRIVRYTPTSPEGPARDVQVIVGQRTEVTEFGTLQHDGLQVWIRAIASDVPELVQGDAIAIDAATYVIDSVEFDRGGTVRAGLISDS